MAKDPERHDAFISHASEDKSTLVRPLAKFLKAVGLDVWYDEFSLKLGDSLSRSIDKGLALSEFGIVVLSPSFLAKRWTEYELQGLISKEISGGKTILPVWYKISRDEVLKYSPTLADKFAVCVTGDSDIPAAALKIIEVVRPDLFEGYHRRLQDMRSSRSAPIETVDISKIRMSGHRHASLSKDLRSRVRAIRAALIDVYPLSMHDWIDGFLRDTNPDKEILIWERVASTYLEHVYSDEAVDRKKVFSQIFGLIAAGQEGSDIEETIRQRCAIIDPIEGREAVFYAYPLDDVPTSTVSGGTTNAEAFQLPLEPLHRFRLSEIGSEIVATGVAKIDISELAEAGIQRLLAEAGAIIGRDRNTGGISIFYGEETLKLFSERNEQVPFPRPIVEVSYLNNSNDLEILFAWVQVLKGGCCYRGNDGKKKRRKSKRIAG